MPEVKEFATFCAAAATFWRTNTLPPGDPVILVEAMTQDLRVTLRNLTVANALRRFIPSRIVVLTGADEEWLGTIWKSFDPTGLQQLSRAYGAHDIIDVHALVDSLLDEPPAQAFTIADQTFLSADLETSIEPDELEVVVHATAARTFRTARIPLDQRADARYQRIRRRGEMFAKLYDTAFGGLGPLALITSHLDYSHWGLAVSSAMRMDVPVLHVQSTGTLKAHAVFPETRHAGLTYRGELTKQVGAFFNRHVWPHREQMRRAAELTTWRNKRNLGRPTWWRRGDASRIEVRSSAERRALRRHAMQDLGLDHDKPVVVVFNHAISDALHTNEEVFEDLGDWFERTVEFTVPRADVNWLFIDHPSQALYDADDFFGRIAERYAGHGHMLFVSNAELSRNVLFSLVDLGLTVRGSVGSELPAYGIPVIQAGWSEWSELGFSALAKDVEDYWRLIGESLAAIKAGSALLTDEQVMKARLWMWFYRGATDVASLLLQPWDLGDGTALYRTLRTVMQQVESDGDPAFEAVHRMWTRREPCLMRFDLSTERDLTDLTAATDHASAVRPASIEQAVGPRLLTIFDTPIEPVTLPGRLHSGEHSALQIADGLIRGTGVVGLFSRSPAFLGLKMKPPRRSDARVRVTMRLSINDNTKSWWEHWVPPEVETRTPGAPRLLSVRAQGRDRAVTLLGFEAGSARRTVSFELERGEWDADGFLFVEVEGLHDDLPRWAANAIAPHGTVGVVLQDLIFAEAVDGETGRPERRDGESMSLCNGVFLARPQAGGTAPTWRVRPVVTAPADATSGVSPTSLESPDELGVELIERHAVRATAVSLKSGEDVPLSVSWGTTAVEVAAGAALVGPTLVGIHVDAGSTPLDLDRSRIVWRVVS